MIDGINKDMYKRAFTKINVSEKAINEVIAKANLHKPIACHKHANRFKIIVPVVVLLTLSVITVSATTQIGISEVFKNLYNQIFDNNNDLNQSQQSFLERYGVTPNKKFIKNNVTMNIEGIIGDSNYVYIKYSISAKNSTDFDSFNSPKLYIGEMTKGNLPADSLVTSKLDEAEFYRSNKAAIFHSYKSGLIVGQTATFVTKAPLVYQPININIADMYKKHGVTALDNSNDIYNIPNSNLSLPFNNEYGGKIVLKSIGFVDSKLILAIDSSNYYEIPTIYLRNKKTNEVYSRCDGLVSAERNNMEFYPYKIDNVDTLKDLEIVMPAEYHFSFPLSYTDSTKIIKISKESPLKIGTTVINEIRISPISLNIAGISTSNSNPIKNCSIRLKDKTSLRIIYNSRENGDPDHGDYSFHSGFNFECPIMLDSMEAIILEFGDNVVEIPVK